MTKLSDLHKEWMKDSEYRTEYEALNLEFEIANALIRARIHSGLTQAQIAERMGTTQSAVARLEGGRSNPSAKTLEKYAKATGTRLRVSLEPVEVVKEAGQPSKHTENALPQQSDVEFATVLD